MHRSPKFVRHRPWSLPTGWIIAQNWHDLLFAHWEVPAEKMRELVPRELEIDTYQGRAWIGVVPFRMSGVRLCGTPAVPGLSAFPELNVRTYVVAEGKPGVWFFSLDAANRVAVEVARAWFHLPYFSANMKLEAHDDEIYYVSQRVDRRGSGESLEVKYRSIPECFEAQPGTLDYFLTERYCLYAQRPDGTLLRGEIHHPPWLLQLARAEFAQNTMTKPLGVELRGEPRLHFAKLQEVIVSKPETMHGKR